MSFLRLELRYNLPPVRQRRVKKMPDYDDWLEALQNERGQRIHAIETLEIMIGARIADIEVRVVALENARKPSAQQEAKYTLTNFDLKDTHLVPDREYTLRGARRSTLLADAELGRLVRGMNVGSFLTRSTGCWMMLRDGRFVGSYDTPEEALKAAGTEHKDELVVQET
jgi:hypothetical protein